MAETNVGANTVLNQYLPTVSSGTVTSLQHYPASTINGITYGVGNGGESNSYRAAVTLRASRSLS